MISALVVFSIQGIGWFFGVRRVEQRNNGVVMFLKYEVHYNKRV